ncbi:class I SAM-dependent methyltransferase [Methanothermobacter wolfeii]|uniref:class I SAM-dependent methyltransferase n=1 Tax=Methanothermobacter wolfeii TaxID=145261 RepID=UPI0024B374B0|nr:class I SAM-dependent methyltransferase [Methanothermobacter wolfeii]MDI6701487.1 class I SAM-dependent methyltransferase [Methanothermobacter wolfeii]MDI6842710.1 class I SAM-dependent methyltransferase [Methanothermobacter wolfeii]
MIRITYDINVYRKVLREILEPHHTVVELGCHVGNSTRIISDLVPEGRVIAIDNSPEAISIMEDLSRETGNVEFISGDVRLHETLERVCEMIESCDVLSVDLGGGYHPDTTFKVYFIWSSTLKPGTSIIRNRGLLDFVCSSMTEESITSRYGWLESSGDAGIPPRLREFKLWSSRIYKEGADDR